MRVLFIGNCSDSGPGNVNKNIVLNLTEMYTWIRTQGKYLQFFEAVLKCFFCDVIVVSGLSGNGKRVTLLADKLHKPVVYIMHGCVEYESIINGFSNSKSDIELEHLMLNKSSLILTVSDKFAKWLSEYLPQYKDKISTLYNGITKPVSIYANEKSLNRRLNSIIAIGGNRPLKNNAAISAAIEEIPDASLEIYGELYEEFPYENNGKTTYMGKVSQEVLFSRMRTSSVFVLNSLFESFSLATIEALNCGCSILISECAGIVGIIKVEECDIIHNPNDKDEIKRKIEFLLNHPNNERLSKQIDYEKYSYKNEVSILSQYCKHIIGK